MLANMFVEVANNSYRVRANQWNGKDHVIDGTGTLVRTTYDSEGRMSVIVMSTRGIVQYQFDMAAHVPSVVQRDALSATIDREVERATLARFGR